MKTLNIQNNLPASLLLTGLALGLPVFHAAAEEVAGPAGPSHELPNRPVQLGEHEHHGVGNAGLFEREHLLGDPGGARSGLEAQGIVVEAVLIADLSKNVSGGVNPAGTFRHLFSLSFDLDLDPLIGLEGGSFFIDLQTKEGQDGSVETGDLQVYSNIDGPDYTAVYEVWYQQLLFEGAVRIKAGKIDANTEFAFVDNGGEFIHSSPGFAPTAAFVLPTYPEPAFGALFFVGQDGDGLYGGAGVFDGALAEGVRTGTRGPSTLFGDPADLFFIGEAGYAWGAAQGVLPGRLAGGVWHHTGGFTTFAGGTDKHTTGFYAVLDQQLLKENTDGDDEQGLYFYAQYGHADGEVSAIDHFAGAGLQYHGPIAGRDDDVVGCMVAYANLSDEPGAGFTDNAETAVELFYKAQVTPWLSIKPDLQYIINPGGAGLTDAWVGTLRAELVF